MVKLCVILYICSSGLSLVFGQNVTPDDEDFADGKPLDMFLSELERKTGLSTLNSTYDVEGIGCSPDFTICTINPNGDILWEVRSMLYSKHMMQNFEGDEVGEKSTIDGCLKYNPTDKNAFKECTLRKLS